CRAPGRRRPRAVSRRNPRPSTASPRRSLWRRGRPWRCRRIGRSCSLWISTLGAVGRDLVDDRLLRGDVEGVLVLDVAGLELLEPERPGAGRGVGSGGGRHGLLVALVDGLELGE